MAPHALAAAAVLFIAPAPPTEAPPPPAAVEFVDYGATSAKPAQTVYDPVCEPFRPWEAQPGDVLMSGIDFYSRVYLMYIFAFTGPPAHAGVVARMPDGRLGVVEAGREGDLSRTTFTPLAERLPLYPAEVWVRRRTTPLTEAESARLTEFAVAADGGRYAILRAMGHAFGTFRTRGPLRTFVMGYPRGIGHTYFCGELVLESLVYAGVLNPHTTRPSAVYPRDFFYDTNSNPYLYLHPPLGGGGWEPPARWVPPHLCRHITFHGPYLSAVVAAGPNPTPDILPGTPPYLSPAPAALGLALWAPKKVENPAATRSEELPTPGPYRFGPTGVPPRLGPGPGDGEPGELTYPEVVPPPTDAEPLKEPE